MKHAAYRNRKPTWNACLAAAILSTLPMLAPVCGIASPVATPAVSQGEAADTDGDEAMRELALFHAARVSLCRALAIAGRLHAGARIADVSFDGQSGAPVYRVRTVQGSHVWEDDVDAKSGALTPHGTALSLKDLETEDRSNLKALRLVRQELTDAVAIAEKAASGKAISGGLIEAEGKPTFIVFVVDGDDHLEQVKLEPPGVGQ